MPNQKTYYLRDDGSLGDSSDAKAPIDEGTIADMAKQASDRIPPGFVVGASERESSRVPNEVDNDVDKNNWTCGLLQVDRPDAVTAKHPAALALGQTAFFQAACDPQANIEIGCGVFESKLDAICSAAGLDSSDPSQLAPDVWAYLAWAHNAGLAGVKKSIATYGLDWQKTKDRNQAEVDAAGGIDAVDADHGSGYMVARMIPYADHVLDLVNQFPFDSSGADSGDSAGSASTIFGRFTPYQLRTAIVYTVAGVLALIAIWLIVGRGGKAIAT